MADSSPPPFNSPKRKREPPPTPPSSSPMPINTALAPAITEREAMNDSPQTKVAYKFQGLKLEGLPEVSKLDFHRAKPPIEFSTVYSTKEDENALRKRMKVLNGGNRQHEIPETPPTAAKTFTISIGPERQVDPVIAEKAHEVTLHNEVDPAIFKGAADRIKGAPLHRAYPSINRLADSKSRSRRRAGTPPLTGIFAMDEDNTGDITDPDRAALTWHDDEISGHDPDDSDDDGEGINGIGFRPTAAIAYARIEKRRQQMAEYKSREAREARAKRSQRRRGSESDKKVNRKSREIEETARRVRFLDAESKSLASSL